MRLSLRALELCRTKLNKGFFCGFQEMDESILDGISEESAKRDFDELTRNGVISLFEGNVHISPLGQHIFHMMLEPDQYIMVDYAESSVCVRIYIRDAYYLCVIADKTVISEDEYNRYTLKLLPRLELVIGSFAYALQRNETHASIEDRDDRQASSFIQIIGKAWNQDREIISEFTVCGDCHEGNIRYQVADTTEGLDELECEPSELINKLTGWMFENISAVNESEVY